MDQKYINLLTLKSYYPIISDKTQKMYIDKEYKCYLFEVKTEGDVFCESLGNVHLDKSRIFKQTEFCTGFYASGADAIYVKPANMDAVTIPITADDLSKQYLNHNLNRAILRLRQTSEKQYLKMFKHEHFIAPAIIGERLKGSYPAIHYSFATANDDKKYFTLFSTLQDFDEWNEKKQENKWHPLEITLQKYERIRQKNPIVINPMTDRLILTDQQIKIAIA